MQSVEKCFTWYRGKWIGARNASQAIIAGVGILFSILAYLVIGLRAINGMYNIGEVALYVGAIATFSGSVVPIVHMVIGMFQNAPLLSPLCVFYNLPREKYGRSHTTTKRTYLEEEME